MRLSGLASLSLALFLSVPAFAQGWVEYVNRVDRFSINFYGEPTVREIMFEPFEGPPVPARIYTTRNGDSTFSVTVVDYTKLEEQGIGRWKACPPGNAQCRDGGTTIGPGYWKQDERGAMAYAAAKYITNAAYDVTDYAWDWQDMVEGFHLQLKSQGTRTMVYIAMHDRKLYILDAAVPEDYPEPGLFTHSMGYLDKEGKRIRYTETVYSNSYHGLAVYPRPQYRTSEAQ